MMNGEGPSVPITTLAGIQSLTDLLLELPLPTPLPGFTGHLSLLSHLRDPEESRRLLNAQEPFLIPTLVDSLSRTATDHIEVKDGYYEGTPHGGQISQLVQFLSSRKPGIFKGAVIHNTSSNMSGDHHSNASPWMPPQRPCPPTGVHVQSSQQQQPAMYPGAAAASPCHPHSSQGNSPAYYTVDHQGPLPGNRLVHNKPASVMPPKSPAAAYSPYAVTTPNQQHVPLHHNAVSHSPGGDLSSGLQDNSPQLFSPPAPGPHISNATAPPNALHSYSNGNCIDGSNLAMAKPNSRTENHIVDAMQPLQPPSTVTSFSSNCSPFSLSQHTPNEASLSSPSSSSSTPQHVNSSNVIPAHYAASGPHALAQVPPQQQQPSVNTFVNSTSLMNNCDIQDRNKPSSHFGGSQPSLALSQTSEKKVSAPRAAPSHTFSDQKKCDATVAAASAEPVVKLAKLSAQDLALAQQDVKQFITMKNLPPTKEGQRQSSSFWEPNSISKSPRRKAKNDFFSNKKDSRGTKRSRDASDDDDEFVVSKGKKDSSSSKKNKKGGRRPSHQRSYIESSGSEEADDDKDYVTKNDSQMSRLQALKKAKKQKLKKEVQYSAEDVMDTNTYQHFSRTVESIFDAMEDIDFSAAIDEDIECPTEALIALPQLQDLCNEAAKLKMLKAMNQFPPERLTRLLNILERNIMDGAKLLPTQNMEEQDEDEAKLWLELTMERVMRSADCSLTALYIMTSPKMPTKVFLEDVIERIVVFLKYQLQNSVFPVFDPAYRLDHKSKDGYIGNIRQKRAHANKVREKSAIQLYNKLHEAVSLLAELLDVQTLTDTIILQVSTLGVSPFFVEGVSELQLNALRLVTTVFANYDKHRQLILEDILASIARLPTSKRSLRNYRLNSEENIQMLTALVLQLIHSVVRLPEPEPDVKNELLSKEEQEKEHKDKIRIDKDVLITTSYDGALGTAINFLSVFLKKCGTKNEEMDYRPLFENFVQDLLSTVNKPEWPASELLLNVLGRILVQHFSNKSMEMTLRVASLDYLGVVAARLRKDAVTSQLRKEMIDDVIQRLIREEEENEVLNKSKKSPKKKNQKDEVQVLQKALLQYLDANIEHEPSLQFSRKFYIAQWYRDAASEIRKNDKTASPSKDSHKEDTTRAKSKHHSKSSSRSNRNRRSSHVSYEEEEEEKEEEEEVEQPADEEAKGNSDEMNARILALAEERKRFLLSIIKKRTLLKINMKDDHIDYDTAELISRYLASKRHFSLSFDLYLSQILRVLSETAVAVRTKAMKCLTLVVEADPSILARPDMQLGVHGRLLDHSTSVREAAVDLVGKFILIRPELTSQYYEMLTDRILDTGVSVRKRVIKILKDICVEQPDFPKTPEICVKIIRRVNDEEGIKKLVGEVFQSMWFTPTSARTPDRVLQKVKNITHVVDACKETGLEWFEQLLTNLLKNKEEPHYKSVVTACQQIVNCLVENVLQLEEASQNADTGASPHLVACLSTLHLFSKIHPPFVVPHATTIQPYLSMKCNTNSDIRVLCNVAQTLELVVPLIEHPSESFLAQIEEDMVKLIIRHGMVGLLQSCISCLGSVVNRVTHNYKLVRDCFQKFLVVLIGFRKEHEKNPENPQLVTQGNKLRRALFTVGLFCRHFDFDTIDSEKMEEQPLKSKVFDGIIYFNNHEDEDIRLKALIGLGFMMIRHYEYMLGPEVKSLYQYLLTSPMASASLKCQVLKNISLYLIEEEARMIQKDAEWSKTSKNEDLKEMGDITSGMASTVIQIYLQQILDSVNNAQLHVRKISLQVIQLILGQGLVHPVQIVPYLICLGSDDDQAIRTRSDQQLQEIEKKYPGFIQMKAMLGVRMSYNVQLLIQRSSIIRGFREQETPSSRNGFLYSVIRGTRQGRRAFVFSLLKLFDEQVKTPLSELLYIADNLVYFPFAAQDEPLFIMHQIDIMLSVSGSNLLQSFREVLVGKSSVDPEHVVENANVAPPEAAAAEDYDEDDDDFETILARLPEDTTALQECIIACQGCMLLLIVKQTLKEMYGFTDHKIQQYSPIEPAKVYERPLNRRHVRFNAKTVTDFIEGKNLQGELDDEGRAQMIHQYLNFKQLMLTIDPSDEDEEEDNQPKPAAASLTALNSATAKAEGGREAATGELPQQNPPLEKTRIVISGRGKSPSHSRTPSRKTPKTPKEKSKKKHKKKRRRLLDPESDSGSDFMDSS